MLYAKAPFSLTCTNKDIFLYSQNGIFMIDNPGMIELLKSIHEVNFIEEDIIRRVWERSKSDKGCIQAVINYLTEETQALIAVPPGFYRREPWFVTSGTIPEKTLMTLFPAKKIINSEELFAVNSTGENHIFIVDMIYSADPDDIENIQNLLSGNSTIIFIFLIGDYFVISHAYTKTIMSPCVLCLYDYVMEKVFSDTKTKINSLASVVDYINNIYRSSAPQAQADELDLFYLMRELNQYLLTLTGNGRCAFTGCDVNQSRLINIHTLERANLTVPFSPKCNCMHQYHLTQGHTNA